MILNEVWTLDHVEDQILSHLRKAHRRVSVERIVSGPELATIYQVLAGMEQQETQSPSDAELGSWHCRATIASLPPPLIISVCVLAV